MWVVAPNLSTTFCQRLRNDEHISVVVKLVTLIFWLISVREWENDQNESVICLDSLNGSICWRYIIKYITIIAIELESDLCKIVVTPRMVDVRPCCPDEFISFGSLRGWLEIPLLFFMLVLHLLSFCIHVLLLINICSKLCSENLSEVFSPLLQPLFLSMIKIFHLYHFYLIKQPASPKARGADIVVSD